MSASLLLVARFAASDGAEAPAAPPKEAVLRHLLRTAATTVYLLGSTPEGHHTRSLGPYGLKAEWEKHNYRHVYQHTDEPSRLMWATHDGYWAIGFRDYLGMLSSNADLRVRDAQKAAVFVEQLDEAEQVWEAKRVDNGTASWHAAPQLRLLAGRGGVLAWEQQQKRTEAALERAAAQLFVVGSAPRGRRCSNHDPVARVDVSRPHVCSSGGSRPASVAGGLLCLRADSCCQAAHRGGCGASTLGSLRGATSARTAATFTTARAATPLPCGASACQWPGRIALEPA